MYWIDVDSKYLDYLRQHECRIPFSNYGDDKYKPFFGTLFQTDDFCYVTQISHPQERHTKMKQAIDFYKIYDNGRLIAVLNLNYMFPMFKKNINPLKMSSIDKIRTFRSNEEKSKYINLLKRELTYINSLPLEQNAIKLYNNKYQYPESNISKRCLDYKALEQIAYQFKE